MTSSLPARRLSVHCLESYLVEPEVLEILRGELAEKPTDVEGEPHPDTSL
jgi:hypothetical protein